MEVTHGPNVQAGGARRMAAPFRSSVWRLHHPLGGPASVDDGRFLSAPQPGTRSVARSDHFALTHRDPGYGCGYPSARLLQEQPAS